MVAGEPYRPQKDLLCQLVSTHDYVGVAEFILARFLKPTGLSTAADNKGLVRPTRISTSLSVEGSLLRHNRRNLLCTKTDEAPHSVCSPLLRSQPTKMRSRRSVWAR